MRGSVDGTEDMATPSNAAADLVARETTSGRGWLLPA